MPATKAPAAPTSPPAPPPPPAATPVPPKPTETPKPAKPTIVIALDSDIDHIEPMEFRSDAGYYATANLYEAPLQQDLVADADGVVLQGQLKYSGGLAESYTVSPDGKLITLKIRQGAKFASGAEITADSFKHTFDRAMTAKRSYIPLLTQFMGISKPEEIVVKDKYTLEIRPAQAAALMVPMLSFQVFGALLPSRPAFLNASLFT